MRSREAAPRYDGLDAMLGKDIGVEKVSLAAVLLLGEAGSRETTVASKAKPDQ